MSNCTECSLFSMKNNILTVAVAVQEYFLGSIVQIWKINRNVNSLKIGK